jgi:ATP-dependent HslUV protease ATP-binding subunit HslU
VVAITRHGSPPRELADRLDPDHERGRNTFITRMGASRDSDVLPDLVAKVVRILREPKNALLKQYTHLLETEGIKVEFSEQAIKELAKIAVDVNRDTENIGARRLHTLLEKLLEDLSFEAPDVHLEKVVITPEYIHEKLDGVIQDRDLSRYIL